MIHGLTNQRCPKCGGNTYIDTDYYLDGGLISWYKQECCLQCGQVLYDLDDSLETMETSAAVDGMMSAKKEPLLV